MMFEVLHAALAGMPGRPLKLMRQLEFAAEQLEIEGFSPEALLNHLKTCGPADEALSALRRRLALWDNADGDWTKETPRNSGPRRSVIYEALALNADWTAFCDLTLPFQPLEEATVIALKNTLWYTPEVRAARSFYWDAYARQLAEANNWSEDSILQLDQNTNRIVEKLADPTAMEAYQSKGLVVGYVQSGKTANFTGLIAKAVDAGYRLIIVMAGTLDVLRSQTQRRLDKELIGRELLDDEYRLDPDYDEFISHNGLPSDQGAFDIRRLTGPDADYKSLAYGKEGWKFDRKDQTKPFWAAENLHPSFARIAVVKKNPTVLQKLATDLRSLTKGKLGAPLDQVPVLIIDDESDQASINTAAPSPSGDVIDRTTTNKAIVGLLNLLPRSQYVGFTATPSANALVDPLADDIFPKDFLISLPRPAGYMGVSDFYDLDIPDDDTIGPNERDYVRSVEGEDDAADNLPRAIDSFVLSGALKLFRTDADPTLKFKHHTMLAHVSTLQVDHKALAKLIQAIYAKAGYEGGKGLERLEALFESDFCRVYSERGGDLPFPETFEDLLPFIGECLQRIGEPASAVKIVNNEHKKDTPDFARTKVWKILVGGAKLSRGYTVEGLSISYYRRRAGSGDTLMQMGRWFGFRHGYRDLVRLFIGTDEVDGGPKSTKRINLYEAFGAICRDEELFRRELVRYAEDPDIIPAAVPPLVPAHMLQPTASNKMRNARITFRNYGGDLSESTFAPSDPKFKAMNLKALEALVQGSTPQPLHASGRNKDGALSLDATVFETTPDKLNDFLKAYHWFDDKMVKSGAVNPMHLQLEFLEGSAGSPGIDRWLVVSPEIGTAQGKLDLEGAQLDVVYRSRKPAGGARFNTYNDKRHRAFAEHLAGIRPVEDASPSLEPLMGPRTGVMLLYPITETKGEIARATLTVGFTLLFPRNAIRNAVGFTVRVPGPFDALVDVAPEGPPTPENPD